MPSTIPIPGPNPGELELAAEAADRAYNEDFGTKDKHGQVSKKNKLDGHTDPVPFVNKGVGFAAFAQRKSKAPNEVTINIRGTDELKDVITDLGMLRAWADLDEFWDLAEFTAKEMQNGTDVLASGHSAGGGAAEMLCSAATEMAGPKAPGKCTVHNIDGPGGKETLEAALDRPLDPEAMARVEGFAHRTEKEKVSLFGTHMVPVATYPLSEKSAPVDPTYGPVWSRSVFDRHSISVFKEEIVEQGVQPKSVQFEKTAFPDLTAIAVAFGPLSADMLTGKANASLVDALSDPYRLENSMTVTKEQKTSPWTGAKHPSIPIEIDGELYGVRGNAEPSAPPKASPSITNPVQERLNAAGYAPGIPQEIAKDYAAGRTSGLTHEEALDHAYGQAQQAAKAKDNMEQTGNLYDAAAKEANEMWANIFDEKPTAVNGSERKVVSAARWSAGDLRATAPEALPTPSTHHPTKTAEDSKVAKNERQKAISMGANTYGVGGALQGLKNAEAAQARTDARNAAQENQDAANRQLEISEQDIERHLGSLPEKPFTITPRNQRTLGRPSFAPSGEFNVEDIQLSIPEGATLSAGTDNGLGGRGRSLQGARQRGAEAVVPGRYSGSKPVGNEGKRGTKRISPGGSHQSGSSVGPQAVTSSSGAAVRSASGAVVTTGQKPGLGEYDGGRHGGGDRRVICTHFVAKRLMSPALQRIDMQFTHERLSAATVRGYHFWAVPYVRLMRRGGILARMASRVMLPIATWRAEEIAHQMGNGGYGPNVKGKIVRLIMEPLCRLIGTFVKPTNYLKLYEEETLR